MKAILSLLSVLALLSVVVSMAGCSAKKGEIDAEAVLGALLNDVKYATELVSAGENSAIYFPDLPKDSKVQLYVGSGYFADEVALIALPSEEDGTAAEEALKKHIAEAREQFADYVPAEVDKIDGAIIYKNGKYVFLCVTDDYDTAKEILENAESYSGSSSVSEGSNSSSQAVESNSEAEDSSADISQSIAPNKSAYPQLKSESGSYYSYEPGVIRVDDMAFELYTYVDSSAQLYADIVNRVSAQLAGKTKVYNLIIPTAAGVTLPDDIAEKLPVNTDQSYAIGKVFSKLSEGVTPVNCFDNMMKHRDEYLYFYTDYHWNGRGAYYAYESFCNTRGFTPIELDERKEKSFAGFLGALYWENSARDPILAANADTVYAYYPKSENATLEITGSDGSLQPWNIITDVSDWKASSKYNTFAGSDSPLAIFKNPDITDGSVCVVVKESFGNALLPYLVDHYSTIYEIDYRYWEGSLADFAAEKGANDLIFANNLSMIRSNFLIGKLANIAV